MMRGPKVELVLERYTESRDAGGAVTKAWSSIRKIKGTLTLIRGMEHDRTDRESLHTRWQFWCHYIKGLDISEKDEFSQVGSRFRYRVVFVDNILEKNNMWKIDLLQVQ